MVLVDEARALGVEVVEGDLESEVLHQPLARRRALQLRLRLRAHHDAELVEVDRPVAVEVEFLEDLHHMLLRHHRPHPHQTARQVRHVDSAALVFIEQIERLLQLQQPLLVLSHQLELAVLGDGGEGFEVLWVDVHAQRSHSIHRPFDLPCCVPLLEAGLHGVEFLGGQATLLVLGEPPVLEALRGRQPLARVHCHHLLHQLDRILRDALPLGEREVIIALLYPLE
mmetsp:Transcript_6354/g.12589  ORF Transcript_6354/g.12589 Transcript_6354/m.12589 type:complete len:226 (+) Transcript_6354:697-1374(+)